MDIRLYKSIINDLEWIKSSNIDGRIFRNLSTRYENVSEETLRSIISLWFQRKVSSVLTPRIRKINLYELYEKYISSGNKFACLSISEKFEYPPALIAKIILTERNKRNKDVKGAKEVRKQLCPYCKAQNKQKTVDVEIENSKITNNQEANENFTLRKHNDPRVELALNLFDEDDEVGKYFLEKFKYSENKSVQNVLFTDRNTESDKNKFYLQASNFEKMGEKNVMMSKNVERLFLNQKFCDRFTNNYEDIQNKEDGLDFKNVNHNETGETSLLKPNQLTEVLNRKDELPKNSITDKCNAVVNREEISQKDYIDFAINHFDTCLSLANSNSNLNKSNSFSDKTELIYCTCSVKSDSDDSDTDTENSKDCYENFSVKELLENTSWIDDPILARDVFLCTVSDDQYGPTSDIITNAAGVTYEHLLEDYVKNAGLPYKTEDNLRDVGVDKTPDIILLVPVAVDGFVINWIESKALFADYKLHQEFKQNQFRNYINRFGPGFVIYWHGYVDEIPELYVENKQLIVRNSFPSKDSFTFTNSGKFKAWMESNKRCE